MREMIVALALVSMAGAAEAAEINIRWGSVSAASHPTVVMIDRVGAAVKQRTNGRIEVQAYPGGQLGGSRDMIENVANGSQQIVNEGAANFGPFVQAISVLEAPYVWRDADHLAKAMDGPIGQEFSKKLVDARGMRILGTLYFGTRHMTTSSKEIKTVADMVGFKLRVPENELYQAMAESWGAKPTPMNFGELYLALKQGVVDGQENPLPMIKSAKFNEVQKYLILTAHNITPTLVVVNEAWWQKLKADDRQVLQEEISKGIAWSNEQVKAAEKTLADELKASGVIVIQPDAESFKKAVLAKVPQKFESRWGKGMFERLQAVQ